MFQLDNLIGQRLMFKTLHRFMIATSFLWAYIILVATFPTNESVTLPGNIQQTHQLFSIEDKDVISMQTVYVINYEPLTYFQRSMLELSQVAHISTITPYEQSLSQLEMFQVGQIQKESSYHQSVITAYQKADYEVSYMFLGYDLVSIPNMNSTLKIGDRIIAVNDVALDENTRLSQFSNDPTLSLEILRNDTSMTILYERKEGDIPLYMFPMYYLSKTSPSIDLKGLDTFIGGPSGGMMMTLSIYATLKNIELNVSIAGTGTILNDGTIGRIGGIVQKYHTVYHRVDYFLIPYDQISSLHGLDIEKVIPIETIDDAITFLESLS